MRGYRWLSLAALACRPTDYQVRILTLLPNTHSVISVQFPSRSGVLNLLSSRANLHLSYNPADRSHCRLQNHHGYIKHHHRGMGGSPGDVGEVPMT